MSAAAVERSRTLTQDVVRAFADAPDERARVLMRGVIETLHDFLRDQAVTHEEWLRGVDFLFRCGMTSDGDRNEFMLMSDVLGVTSLVDLLDLPAGATPGSPLGPFYRQGAPALAVGGDLVGDNGGDIVRVEGRVVDLTGAPIAGAMLDMWQTDAEGLYPSQDPAQHPDNLRCRQTTDSAGRYGFTTVRPAPYSVPMDGPAGEMLRAFGRAPWRAAHWHVIVSAPGRRTLVTELFVEDDPWIAQDAAFGVRPELVHALRPDASTDARGPQWTYAMDFRLAPVAPR